MLADIPSSFMSFLVDSKDHSGNYHLEGSPLLWYFWNRRRLQQRKTRMTKTRQLRMFEVPYLQRHIMEWNGNGCSSFHIKKSLYY